MPTLLRRRAVPARKPLAGSRLAGQHPLARGLIGFWPLGDTVQRPWDARRRYVATVGGGAPGLAPGVRGGLAATFNGSADYYTSSGPEQELGGRTQASLSAWLYRASTAHTVAVGHSTTSNSRFYLLWYSDANLYLTAENGQLSFPFFALSGTGWHHVVLAWNGDNAGNRMVGYLDGVEQTLTVGGQPPAAALDTAANLGPLVMGYDISNSSLTTGRVEQVGAWTRQLSAADVTTLYRRPGAWFAQPAWYPTPLWPATTPQLAYPTSDIGDGGWLNESGSATDLYASVDEVTLDEADWIQSSSNPQDDAVELGLGALSDPGVDTGHKLKVWWKRV